MKSAFFCNHGGLDVLEYGDRPEPSPGVGQVIIRIHSAALNHLDLWVRQGWPGLKLPLPHVLGSDVAGVVERTGAEISDLAKGTEVLVNPGLSCGVCEKCLLGEDNLCREYQI